MNLHELGVQLPVNAKLNSDYDACIWTLPNRIVSLSLSFRMILLRNLNGAKLYEGPKKRDAS